MCRDRCEIELRHGRHIVFDFHSATERRSYFAVHFVGKAIEAEMKAEIDAKPIAEQPAEHMIFGIDGTFVGATRSKNQRKPRQDRNRRKHERDVLRGA